MESRRRPGFRGRMALLAVVPCVLAAFLPTSTAVADEATPAPVPAEQPAPPEETAPTEESVAEPAEEPVAQEPVAQEPVAQEPVAQEPVAQEPVAQEPVAQEPVAHAALVPTAKAEDKVTICHRTNSRTNPYDQIVVSQSSAISGHASHTGPIFGPDVDNWGDIIPPIRPGLPGGLNWPAGRDVLENGCEMEPDVGPLPEASIADAECVGTNPSIAVTVSNDADATQSANFSILVDGSVVETVGPVAPGDSETVVLDGAAVGGLEDQTVTIAVRSDGEIIASRVVTVNCEPDPPSVEISAELACDGDAAQGTVTVVNNGQAPVTVSATVDGAPLGTPVVVTAGATGTGTADLSPYEDQTVTVDILVDGDVVATYEVTPDCVAPQAGPRVSVAGQVCPPPSATVTLANDGDPASTVVFVIRVNGRVVQESAPLYGGDQTTIVGDLSRFEDQRVTVSIRANGELLGRRTFRVDCVQESGTGPVTGAGPAGTASGSNASGPGVLPSVGADVSPGLVALGLGLLGAGSLLLLAGSRRTA